MSTHSARPRLKPGSRLGHFEIVSVLGAGGMGVVFEAKDLRLDRRVALKVLSQDLFSNDVARSRFLREAKLAASITHPNIATIHEVDQEDGTPFIAMELVNGRNLKDALLDGPLALERVISIGVQVCDALAAAHTGGVVHRDIKSANIMLTPQGSIKILDFGLAKAVRASARPDDATPARAWEIADDKREHSLGSTAPGEAVGTLRYMSPEQATGQAVDARSDIFSLGIVLYESATANLPFRDSSEEEILAVLRSGEPIPVGKELPGGLSRLVARCLDKHPERRFSSATELKYELNRLSGNLDRRRAPWRKIPWLAAAAAVTAAAAFALFAVLSPDGLQPPAPSQQEVELIAVLPFEDLSEDETESYLAGAIALELTSSIGQIGALKVVPWTFMRQFRDSPGTIDEISQLTGADAIIEGSVQKLPPSASVSVRVYVQLFEARTGLVIWSQTIQKDLGDFLTVAREISKEVATRLHAKLERREEIRLSQARQVDPEAMELYLKGRDLGDETERALEYFQLAVQKDPDFAEAHAALAIAHVLHSTYGGVEVSPEEAYVKATDAIDRALEVDPGLGEAWASRGLASFLLGWEWANAENEFQRALELSPNSPVVHQWYANFLTPMGRHREAIEHSLLAEERAPLSPAYSRRVGWSYFMARQYEEAIEQLSETLSTYPDFTPARTLLGRAYIQTGAYEAGIAELEAVGDAYLDLLAQAYAAAGREADARATLERLFSSPPEIPRRPYLIALAYAALGESDTTIEWLERAYNDHDPSLVNLRNDPRLDPIRGDPRLDELMARMGFPPLEGSDVGAPP